MKSTEEKKDAVKAGPSKAKHGACLPLCQNHGLQGVFASHLICRNNSPLAKYFTRAVVCVWQVLLPVCPIFAWLTWRDCEPGVSLSRLFGCDSSYPAKSEGWVTL